MISVLYDPDLDAQRLALFCSQCRRALRTELVYWRVKESPEENLRRRQAALLELEDLQATHRLQHTEHGEAGASPQEKKESEDTECPTT